MKEEKNKIEISYVRTSEKGFIIGWIEPGFGFGELTFNGEKIDSECMGSDFCEKVFKAFVEKYLPDNFKDKN